MRLQNSLGAASNLTAGLIGLVVGVAISSGSPGTIAWLHTWETLITGVLAVGAAALTVVAMWLVDQRQERRFFDAEERQKQQHRDLMLLSVRGDRLKLQRAAAQTVELLHLSGRAAKWSGNVQDASSFYGRSRAWLANVKDSVKHRGITDAEPLYDPITFTRSRVIEHSLDIIENDLETLREAMRVNGEDIATPAASVAEMMAKAATEMAGFCEAIKRLNSEYGLEGVHSTRPSPDRS